MKYKVEFFINDTYQVLENTTKVDSSEWYNPTITIMIPPESWEVVFQGTLPECDAFINLKKKGYM